MKMNILGAISIMLFSVGCEKLVNHVYSIKIQNATADTIQFYASYTYPDTTITNEKPRLQTVSSSTYSYWDSKKKWEDILPSGTISIYILNKDTVDRYGWDKIRSDYNVLKRYDLSLDDLKKRNWMITYSNR